MNSRNDEDQEETSEQFYERHESFFDRIAASHFKLRSAITKQASNVPYKWGCAQRATAKQYAVIRLHEGAGMSVLSANTWLDINVTGFQQNSLPIFKTDVAEMKFTHMVS